MGSKPALMRSGMPVRRTFFEAGGEGVGGVAAAARDDFGGALGDEVELVGYGGEGGFGGHGVMEKYRRVRLGM